MTTEDPAFHRDFHMANRRFFDAPCAVYLCMDQTLGTWSMFDLGAMCQSICLAAQDHGVESAIAINLVVYPDVLRDELLIPRDLLIVIGIALGYADPSRPGGRFPERAASAGRRCQVRGPLATGLGLSVRSRR